MAGRSKPLLTLQGETFLLRKIRLLSNMCGTLMVVAAPGASFQHPDVRVVYDEVPGMGPLMGILTGLRQSRTDVNFITAVDNPFPNLLLAQYLLENVEPFDAFLPRWNGFIEPLFGAYKKSCIPAIEHTIGGSRHIHTIYPYISVGFAPACCVQALDPEGSSFININTETEYDSLQKTSRDKGKRHDSRIPIAGPLSGHQTRRAPSLQI